MRVPFLDLTAQLRTTGPAVERAVLDVVRSGRYVGGPAIDAFEAEMAGHLEVDHAVAVSSGTDALLAALMALEVGPGDLVLTTPYSFFATAGVVARLGAEPVFVDIDPRTYNVDPGALTAWWERHADRRKRVRAIVPVHLFGRCADMEPILALAAAHGIHVVEDAAQALGARWGAGERGGPDPGRPAGTLGTFGCYSFYPTKNLGAMGHGGLVVTRDPGLAAAVRQLRDHGAHPPYHHARIGGNFQLDAVQAAVLRAKLPHLDGWHDARRTRAAYYDRHLPAAGVMPPARAARAEGHVYNQYVIRVPDRRDPLRAHLAAQGIDTMVYYPVPLHRQACFRHLGHAAGAFPHSEAAAASSLALPVYPELTPAMQDRVIEGIADFYRAGA
ncbi:MAG: DegT/DnrJ/EryC1/StrS family aminotransferase [Acidobacteria bacterium]|nr:DegT/DnrJ/EryC1/StrS family aminotransferase [Acidobacteriota bacterium]